MRASLIVATTFVCGLLNTCHKETATFSGTSSVKPIRVLILGDDFSSQQEFDGYAATMKAAIEATPGAAAAGQMFDIRSKKATAATGVKHSGDCYFEADDAVLKTVRKDGITNFDAQRYVVVVNVTGTQEGCSYGDVTFIARNTDPKVVAHEMGHNLAGLFDEYGSKPDAPANVNFRNCSSPPAYWSTEVPTSFANCDHFFTLLRPTNNCIMRTPNSQDFCAICKKHLKCALADGLLGGCPEGPAPTTLPPAVIAGAAEGLEVVAIIDRSGNLQALSAKDVQISSLRPQVITSDMFAVVRDGERIVGVAPLSMSNADVETNGDFPLTARAYGRGYEQVVPVSARLIRFTVSGVTRATVKNHHLTLDLRRLTNARRRFFLDDATVNQLSGAPFSPPYPLQLALEPLPP